MRLLRPKVNKQCSRVQDLASGQNHDRRSYYGYSADRTIQTRKPGVTFANNLEVLNANRVTGEDPDYIINDAIRDICH